MSHLLANVLLDELDKELEERGHAFCRYADDCAPRRSGEEPEMSPPVKRCCVWLFSEGGGVDGAGVKVLRQRNQRPSERDAWGLGTNAKRTPATTATMCTLGTELLASRWTPEGRWVCQAGSGGATPMVPRAWAIVGEPVVAGGCAGEAARLVLAWGSAPEVGGGWPERLWGRWDAKAQGRGDALGGSRGRRERDGSRHDADHAQWARSTRRRRDG